MNIMTIPHFTNYGMAEDGRIMSNAHGSGWKELKVDKLRKCIKLCKDGKQYAITVQKFRFCAINQIDPRFKSKGILVSKEGELITFKERDRMSKETISRYFTENKQELIDKQIKQLEFEQKLNMAAIRFLTVGDSSELLRELVALEKDTEVLCKKKFYNIPKELITNSLLYAQDAVLKSLSRGKVFNIYGLFVKTARGFIKTELKNCMRLSEWNWESSHSAAMTQQTAYCL